LATEKFRLDWGEGIAKESKSVGRLKLNGKVPSDEGGASTGCAIVTTGKWTSAEFNSEASGRVDESASSDSGFACLVFALASSRRFFRSSARLFFSSSCF